MSINQMSKGMIEKIQNDLYHRVKLIIENKNNIEENINPEKRGSTKIIFKDRDEAIYQVAKMIEQYAKKYQLQVEDVKTILLDVIQNDISKKDMFQQAYYEVKDIVSSEKEER